VRRGEALKSEDKPADAAELRLARRILFGILAGAALGQAAFVARGGDVWVQDVAHPVGTIWLNLLLVMMLPLASSALVLGILGLEPREVGRIGLRALVLTVTLTAIAVVVGLSSVALVRPGAGVDPSTLPAAAVRGPAPIRDPMELLIAQFPSNIVAAASSNNLVPVLVFAVLFGLALRATKTEGAAAIVKLVEGVFEVSARAVHFVLRLAPIGVAALTFEMAGRGGLEALLPVARFAGTVLLALGVQMFVVYPLTLRFVGKYPPLAFFRAIRPAMAVAFSTASSAATLPTSLEIGENRLGLRRDAVRFVLTVGATANQNGTALFEGLAVVFFAQLYGVHLGLVQQAGIIAISVLAGVGTAGVPAGSLPVITALLVTLGIPEQAIGIIVGVDRLLDMARTTLNVTGDLVIAATVSGREEAAR
jgi:DAACS family dicarboxylate/amino acid:cation (Na+ or H+) symporter